MAKKFAKINGLFNVFELINENNIQYYDPAKINSTVTDVDKNTICFVNATTDDIDKNIGEYTIKENDRFIITQGGIYAYAGPNTPFEDAWRPIYINSTLVDNLNFEFENEFGDIITINPENPSLDFTSVETSYIKEEDGVEKNYRIVKIENSYDNKINKVAVEFGINPIELKRFIDDVLQGSTAEQGPQGVTGLEGPVGATGIQGVTGLEGPVGATGIQGVTGLEGETGPQGNGFYAMSEGNIEDLIQDLDDNQITVNRDNIVDVLLQEANGKPIGQGMAEGLYAYFERSNPNYYLIDGYLIGNVKCEFEGEPVDHVTYYEMHKLKGDDGAGIDSIVKTGTTGLVDTYTITYTDDSTSTFNITNGEDGGVYTSGSNIDITNNVISAKGYTYNKQKNSFAEGDYSSADGDHSHAEGSGTIGIGTASHAEGIKTITSNEGEHAEGKYNMSHTSNISDTKNRTMHSIGIGSAGSGDPYDRKNAFEVMENGDVYLYGIGGYIGTNPSQERSLQQIINNKQEKLLYITEYPTGGPGGSGSIGISVQTSITGDLMVSDKVNAVNGFYQTSDINKKNILGDLDLEKAYNLIDKCQTILYTLKEDKNDTIQLGLIAQEVNEFFPEIVYSNNGVLGIDYSRLSVIILKLLKDIIKRLSELENK